MLDSAKVSQKVYNPELFNGISTWKRSCEQKNLDMFTSKKYTFGWVDLYVLL